MAEVAAESHTAALLVTHHQSIANQWAEKVLVLAE